jgi:hypothetical protein
MVGHEPLSFGGRSGEMEIRKWLATPEIVMFAKNAALSLFMRRHAHVPREFILRSAADSR